MIHKNPLHGYDIVLVDTSFRLSFLINNFEIEESNVVSFLTALEFFFSEGCGGEYGMPKRLLKLF